MGGSKKVMKMKIPHSPVHLASFLLLAFLCYQAHQVVRHFVGALLCGGFGSMTFTVAVPLQSCILPVMVTLSGPVLTYGLAWLGMFLLGAPRFARFAWALVFASFAHLRFIQTLTGRGDELILARQWFGISNRLLVAAAVFLMGLPPVLAAFNHLKNERKMLIVISSWLLPLPLLFIMLVGDRILFGESHRVAAATSILGISQIVLIIDLIAALLMFLFGPRYLLTEESG
jgi:hypothetical protein